MSGFFRQLGRSFKRFGRQAGHDLSTFGRQAKMAFKLVPGAFRDASKIYSSLEAKTHGVPIVSQIFGAAAKGTGAIGDGLSGNFSKSWRGGQDALNTGMGAFNSAVDAGAKVAPYVAFL